MDWDLADERYMRWVVIVALSGMVLGIASAFVSGVVVGAVFFGGGA